MQITFFNSIAHDGAFNMSSIDWNMSTTLESSAHLATATSSINTSENGSGMHLLFI